MDIEITLFDEVFRIIPRTLPDIMGASTASEIVEEEHGCGTLISTEVSTRSIEIKPPKSRQLKLILEEPPDAVIITAGDDSRPTRCEFETSPEIGGKVRSLVQEILARDGEYLDRILYGDPTPDDYSWELDSETSGSRY